MENKRQTISRPLASHLRQQSMGASSSGASPVLLARINEKKQELANLKELQALSAGLADQMEVLEKKLSTLSDGTEGAHIRKCSRRQELNADCSKSCCRSTFELAQRPSCHQHGLEYVSSGPLRMRPSLTRSSENPQAQRGRRQRTGARGECRCTAPSDACPYSHSACGSAAPASQLWPHCRVKMAT